MNKGGRDQAELDKCPPGNGYNNPLIDNPRIQLTFSFAKGLISFILRMSCLALAVSNSLENPTETRQVTSLNIHHCCGKLHQWLQSIWGKLPSKEITRLFRLPI